MNSRKAIYVFVGFLLMLLVAGAFYRAQKKSKPVPPSFAAQSSATSGPKSPEIIADVEQVNPEVVTEKVANFLGSLTPGGTAESAGRERKYVVSYQVAFLRKTPAEKAPEEGLSYDQLRDRRRMAPPRNMPTTTAAGAFP